MKCFWNAYDSHTVVKEIEEQQCLTVIAPKENPKISRVHDEPIDQGRH